MTQAVFTAKIIEDKSFFSRLSCAVKKSIVLHYCTVFASIETIFICSVRKNILLHYFIVFTSVYTLYCIVSLYLGYPAIISSYI